MKPKFSCIVLLFLSIQSLAQVRITDLRVLPIDSAVSLHSSILLPYKYNHIAIYVADSTDTNPALAYYLENTDMNSQSPKWVQAGSLRVINYANLYGGRYVFHLKNAHNQSETLLAFNIELLFWQRWWFVPMMFVYALAVVGIVIYLILQYRFRQQLKLQRVRNDIASDLHDDVGATLSSISFLGEMMQDKLLKKAPPEEVLPLLKKVIHTSKETVETMRGVVWTINPNNDFALDFFQKLHTFGKEMLATKQIMLQFEVKGFENQKLPLQIQRNLFLLYKECINNIAKHSQATDASVSFTKDNQGLTMQISDNGTGFDPHEIYEGHGLRNLQKRAKDLDGTLTIQSAKAEGAKIRLIIGR